MINVYNFNQISVQNLMKAIVILIAVSLPFASYAGTITGPIKILNVGQKKFSIDGTKYKVAKGVRIKELFNETHILLFAQLHAGDYLKIDFIESHNQPKKVTKVYLVPQ
jgi:hypothetical protein